MYAIKEGTRKINDVKFRTFERNVKYSRADVDVEAGSTGLRGVVPREKSARGFVALDCNFGDFFFEPIEDEEGRITGFGIACCGDSAVMALMEALSFAQRALLDQCTVHPA